MKFVFRVDSQLPNVPGDLRAALNHGECALALLCAVEVNVGVEGGENLAIDCLGLRRVTWSGESDVRQGLGLVRLERTTWLSWRTSAREAR